MSNSNDVDLTRSPRKPKKATGQRPKYAAPDGRHREPSVEHDINEAFAITFASAAGQKVLNYLRSVTTHAAFQPGTDPNIIVQMEGARWLMGIIDTRTKHGEEKKP